MFMVDVEVNHCRRQNLLLLIRFQHEGSVKHELLGHGFHDELFN